MVLHSFKFSCLYLKESQHIVGHCLEMTYICILVLKVLSADIYALFQLLLHAAVRHIHLLFGQCSHLLEYLIVLLKSINHSLHGLNLVEAKAQTHLILQPLLSSLMQQNDPLGAVIHAQKDLLATATVVFVAQHAFKHCFLELNKHMIVYLLPKYLLAREIWRLHRESGGTELRVAHGADVNQAHHFFDTLRACLLVLILDVWLVFLLVGRKAPGSDFVVLVDVENRPHLPLLRPTSPLILRFCHILLLLIRL